MYRPDDWPSWPNALVKSSRLRLPGGNRSVSTFGDDRAYPAKPKVGQRASKPNELWHVDLTIIKLLDGTKVYLHAVIDNFSRRILAWCIDTHFNAMNTVTILQQAARQTISVPQKPVLVVDAGVENVNKDVDDFRTATRRLPWSNA